MAVIMEPSMSHVSAIPWKAAHGPQPLLHFSPLSMPSWWVRGKIAILCCLRDYGKISKFLKKITVKFVINHFALFTFHLWSVEWTKTGLVYVAYLFSTENDLNMCKIGTVLVDFAKRVPICTMTMIVFYRLLCKIKME
jgi:hypothetical protein